VKTTIFGSVSPPKHFLLFSSFFLIKLINLIYLIILLIQIINQLKIKNPFDTYGRISAKNSNFGVFSQIKKLLKVDKKTINIQSKEYKKSIKRL
jgi:Zn-dependent membrane protease YugP